MMTDQVVSEGFPKTLRSCINPVRTARISAETARAHNIIILRRYHAEVMQGFA